MKKIYTIGHGTKTLKEFIDILQKNKIQVLADIRSYPGSRMVPHYNKEKLEKSLSLHHILYIHIPELGGRRNFKNVHHPAIKEKGFSSYAEYMMTIPFLEGYSELQEIAKKYKTAYMCAETLYWQCHRRMVSDRLTFDKWKVYHLGMGKPIVHKIWDIAQMNKKGQIIYNKS